MQVRREQDARREPLGRDEALALARQAGRLLVARGRKLIEIDMKRDRPDDETLAGLLLGRSGTLRAPALRRGRTLIVGFHPEAFERLVGAT